MAYLLARSAWGRGLGKEAARAIRDYAFRQIPVDKLVSCIDHENVASKRVAEDMGMAFEQKGLDEFGSFAVYSISRNQWEQSSPSPGVAGE